MPQDDAGWLDRYVAVGVFVVDRWLAEELDRIEGQPLDEQACWARWDQCSEKHLRDLRTEASQLVAEEITQRRLRTLAEEWLHRIEPGKNIISGLSWLFMEAFRGFIGGIGLLIFGLLIVWAAPRIARSVRSAVDDTLPASTRPSDFGEQHNTADISPKVDSK